MGIFFQNLVHHADVVELVDTLDSGSSAREGMKVQVLSSALKNPVVFTAGFLYRHSRSGMNSEKLARILLPMRAGRCW